jgi:hypothetical protein
MDGALLNFVWWHWLLAAFLVGFGWTIGCGIASFLVGWRPWVRSRP